MTTKRIWDGKAIPELCKLRAACQHFELNWVYVSQEGEKILRAGSDHEGDNGWPYRDRLSDEAIQKLRKKRLTFTRDLLESLDNEAGKQK